MKKMTKKEFKRITKESNIKNIVKENDIFIVAYNGKIKEYKRLSAAIKFAKEQMIPIEIPVTVTASTFFWIPAGNASGRRRNEQRRGAELDYFCSEIMAIPDVSATWNYSETCHNVYCSVHFRIGNRQTNLTGIKNHALKNGFELI